ncbi:MAG: APH(3')-II family aminoglycoside O-phosphotransferase, partial [Stenotrophomonas sp.]|nr:APH(3')-II family aminoglycoside O-phosphotransferase [Stenotrophomonas sp.]
MEAPNPFTDGMPLPWAWRKTLADARIERQSIGVSREDVARVHRP